jgi:hypothetical protein
MGSEGTSFGTEAYREHVAQTLASILIDVDIKQLVDAKWRLHLRRTGRSKGAPDIGWGDILDWVRSYRAQLDFSEEHDLQMMCIEFVDGRSPIPVSIDVEVMTKLLDERTPFSSSSNWISALETWFQRQVSIKGKMGGYSVADAIAFFKKGLTKFVSTRMGARSSKSLSHSDYPFEVSTKSDGLRVYWTPAAICRKGKSFGYPTTPVSSRLPPGTYCFGAGPPGGIAHYEMTAYYDVPASDHAYLDV